MAPPTLVIKLYLENHIFIPRIKGSGKENVMDHPVHKQTLLFSFHSNIRSMKLFKLLCLYLYYGICLHQFCFSSNLDNIKLYLGLIK